jgi:hypothetical protein
MGYPFPLIVTDPAPLQKALDIAMGYLEHIGQAFPLARTEHTCARVIFEKWRDGGKEHPISLANRAIVAVEKMTKPRRETNCPAAGSMRGH